MSSTEQSATEQTERPVTPGSNAEEGVAAVTDGCAGEEWANGGDACASAKMSGVDLSLGVDDAVDDAFSPEMFTIHNIILVQPVKHAVKTDGARTTYSDMFERIKSSFSKTFKV